MGEVVAGSFLSTDRQEGRMDNQKKRPRRRGYSSSETSPSGLLSPWCDTSSRLCAFSALHRQGRAEAHSSVPMPASLGPDRPVCMGRGTLDALSLVVGAFT